MSETPRRRRRVRSSESTTDAAAAELSTPVAGSPRGPAPGPTQAGRTASGADDEGITAHTSAVADEPVVWVAEVVESDTLPAERGLRGLVGGGSSQVSPTAALRARDAARPRPQDIARAESDLAIVRRNWSPRE